MPSHSKTPGEKAGKNFIAKFIVQKKMMQLDEATWQEVSCMHWNPGRHEVGEKICSNRELDMFTSLGLLVIELFDIW